MSVTSISLPVALKRLIFKWNSGFANLSLGPYQLPVLKSLISTTIM
jgi:hypothetical protein